MRTMLRISMDVEASNKAIKEGWLPKLVSQTTELVKPESTYFTTDHGKRTAYFVFDLKDSSMMPSIAEPWFAQTNASIDIMPVMNADELKTGLEKIKR